MSDRKKGPPVTVAMLRKRGACAGGIESFREAFGERLDVTEAACLAGTDRILLAHWVWALRELCSFTYAAASAEVWGFYSRIREAAMKAAHAEWPEADSFEVLNIATTAALPHAKKHAASAFARAYLRKHGGAP